MVRKKAANLLEQAGVATVRKRLDYYLILLKGETAFSLFFIPIPCLKSVYKGDTFNRVRPNVPSTFIQRQYSLGNTAIC
jgi:hypothetical protein